MPLNNSTGGGPPGPRGTSVPPLDLAVIRAHFPDRAIHWHDTLPSTMPEAVRLAEDGAASGTVVGADEQTAGRGRFDRSWHSARDTGLWQSIIIRLPQTLPTVTLALGLATAAAIEHTTGISTDLRWPNDVLIGNKKVAGILTQLHGCAVVAGIGINVNQDEFPADVAAIATSLKQATGKPHSREPLLIALLNEIDTHCAILVEKGAQPILEMFEQASSFTRGRRVIVDDRLTGTTAGLTPDGFLKLRKDDGSFEIILAGGVRPCS